MKLECVQQASIITGVSLTTFTRGFCHYCSLGGHTARPDWLPARLCHAFVVKLIQHSSKMLPVSNVTVYQLESLCVIHIT